MPTANHSHQPQQSHHLFACSTPCCDVMDRPRELTITADPGQVAVIAPPGEVAIFTPFQVWGFYQMIEKAALASMYAPQTRKGYPHHLATAQPSATAVKHTSPGGVEIALSSESAGCINRKSA